MAQVLVIVTDNATGENVDVRVNEGSTVESVIRMAFPGLDPSGVTIRKNRQSANLHDSVYNADRISVTRKDLKGADDVDLTNVSFEQLILQNGSAEGTLTEGVYSNALNILAKRVMEVSTREVLALTQLARNEGGRLNRNIADLERALELNRQRQSELDYAVQQLKVNNIFALMGVLGLKDRAEAICSEIGCMVPDDDSPVWNTSPPEEQDEVQQQ